MAQAPLLIDVLPTLAEALKPSLLRANEPGLAASIDTLRVEALCGCPDPDCMKFYTTPEFDRPCPGFYRVATPDAVLTMGVCEEAVHSIEDMRYLATETRVDEFVRLRSVVKRRRR